MRKIWPKAPQKVFIQLGVKKAVSCYLTLLENFEDNWVSLMADWTNYIFSIRQFNKNHILIFSRLYF